MSYIEKNLLPSEHVIYRTKLHWIEYVAKVCWFAAVGLMAGLMIWLPFATLIWVPYSKELQFWGVILVVGLFSLFGFALAWINVATSEFAVTNNRVLVKVGVIRRHSLEIVLRQVEGIGVDQGILGRILGFGTIIVSGTGATKEPFIRINKPLEFRRQVQVLTSA
jgi:uncharacterized membrane protein YdbT with pleckstrin-like domain